MLRTIGLKDRLGTLFGEAKLEMRDEGYREGLGVPKDRQAKPTRDRRNRDRSGSLEFS